MGRKQQLAILLLVIVLGLGWFRYKQSKPRKLLTPLGEEAAQEQQRPLTKYTFANLKQRQPTKSKITFADLLAESSSVKSYLFYFTSEGKKVSGVATIPFRAGKFPIIIMLRGYVDQQQYTSGTGTKHAALVLAKRGYITLAPDFLGYGKSASPSADPFAERFEKYTTTLDLIAALPNLPTALGAIGATTIKPLLNKVGLWGHSNGGQIAISILEITGQAYPTVLWAPVSKPFPYSILYYTDEFEDHGKALRKALAKFEEQYDVEAYSPTNFFSWINPQTPIQLHQGSADEAVPQKWSDQLNQQLNQHVQLVEYYTYPGEDHHFSRGSWARVISRTVSFYNTYLKELN